MNFEEAPRLFYLILLLMFIGSYFLYERRQRFSQTVQQALIWVGIFALMIIAYGYRDVLTGELFPTQARQIDAETIALSRGPSGSFVATLTVNDRDIEFLVDTGATNVVLSQADARRAGFDPDRLDYSGRASTANGVVETAPVTIDRIEFAGFVDTGIRASVNGGELEVSLLGMDYLDRFDRIEIQGNRMLLTRR